MSGPSLSRRDRTESWLDQPVERPISFRVRAPTGSFRLPPGYEPPFAAGASGDGGPVGLPVARPRLATASSLAAVIGAQPDAERLVAAVTAHAGGSLAAWHARARAARDIDARALDAAFTADVLAAGGIATLVTLASDAGSGAPAISPRAVPDAAAGGRPSLVTAPASGRGDADAIASDAATAAAVAVVAAAARDARAAARAALCRLLMCAAGGESVVSFMSRAGAADGDGDDEGGPDDEDSGGSGVDAVRRPAPLPSNGIDDEYGGLGAEPVSTSGPSSSQSVASDVDSGGDGPGRRRAGRRGGTGALVDTSAAHGETALACVSVACARALSAAGLRWSR